jgi:hypothetical protein
MILILFKGAANGPRQFSAWIAQTTTTDITNVSGAAAQLAQAIVAELLKDKVTEP